MLVHFANSAVRYYIVFIVLQSRFMRLILAYRTHFISSRTLGSGSVNHDHNLRHNQASPIDPTCPARFYCWFLSDPHSGLVCFPYVLRDEFCPRSVLVRGNVLRGFREASVKFVCFCCYKSKMVNFQQQQN